MNRRTFVATFGVLLFSVPSFAQSSAENRGGLPATIFLVRHAERADTAAGKPAMSGSDPSLSSAGHQRAQSLAVTLKDAEITAIYVTEFRRTQETAAPFAKAAGVTPTIVPSKDVQGLLAKLRETKGNVLVVGHSNSVPDVIKGLGVATSVTIGDAEFDHLFIVTPQTRLIQLRYR